MIPCQTPQRSRSGHRPGYRDRIERLLSVV